MLSPIYRKKLEELDAEFDNNMAQKTQRDRYQKESEIVIDVKWWNEVCNFSVATFIRHLTTLLQQDDQPPLKFLVPAPEYPYFHPKDSSIISDVIGLSNCKNYSFFDTTTGFWTFTSLPQRVKARATLYLRSRDVSICPGLDYQGGKSVPVMHSKKRALSVANDDTAAHVTKHLLVAVSDDK
jgi:hypothetical protein